MRFSTDYGNVLTGDTVMLTISFYNNIDEMQTVTSPKLNVYDCDNVVIGTEIDLSSYNTATGLYIYKYTMSESKLGEIKFIASGVGIDGKTYKCTAFVNNQLYDD